MDVQKRIYDLMEARGWTTYALAEHAGLAQSTVAHTVSKGKIPTIATLEKICEAFGITLSEFFMEEDIDETDEKFQMVSMIGTLSPKRKELTKAIIKEFQSK